MDNWNNYKTKIKRFCKGPETIKKPQRLPTTWEKRLANDLTNKELTSKIYEGLTRLYIKKITWLQNGQGIWTDIF